MLSTNSNVYVPTGARPTKWPTPAQLAAGRALGDPAKNGNIRLGEGKAENKRKGWHSIGGSLDSERQDFLMGQLLPPLSTVCEGCFVHARPSQAAERDEVQWEADRRALAEAVILGDDDGTPARARWKNLIAAFSTVVLIALGAVIENYCPIRTIEFHPDMLILWAHLTKGQKITA
jgi:hypothetical protein